MNLYQVKPDPFIFLAEDDTDDQELLIEALSTIDPSVIVRTANNGRKAINLLEDLEPHQIPTLIVLDFNLPELSGAEVLKHLNTLTHYQHVTKIVWSTSNSPIYEKICLHLGAKAYIVKPSDIAGINRLAAEMIRMCLVR